GTCIKAEIRQFQEGRSETIETQTQKIGLSQRLSRRARGTLAASAEHLPQCLPDDIRREGGSAVQASRNKKTSFQPRLQRGFWAPGAARSLCGPLESEPGTGLRGCLPGMLRYSQ